MITKRLFIRLAIGLLLLSRMQGVLAQVTTVPCGGQPLDETYCYVNNDAHSWHWQSSGGEALIMSFSEGAIENAAYDHLRIYDGVPGAPGTNLLWENTLPFPGTQLAGLQLISPTGHIYMANTSDGSQSCQSGSYAQWVWQVDCLECTPPLATYSVVNDCANSQFSVDVHITALGSDPTLDIMNDGGALPVVATAAGTYTVGPFANGTTVVVNLGNDMDTLCSVHSSPLTNALCPTIIQCGGAPLDESYCYINNDSHTWHWQSSGVEPLIIIFSAGTIESATYDHLRIYDGQDNTGPLLYDHVGGAENLAGLQRIAPSGHIFMENSSDGSGSCQGGGQTEWVWQVGCLDCVPPLATFAVVVDCDQSQFSVDVNITQLGSDQTLDITNDGGALPAVATAVGTYTVGPFANGTTVVVNLENDVNTLCSLHSIPLTNTLCPTIIQCGGAPLDESYCYINNDSHTWHWQSSGVEPLIIIFSAGTIESATYDHLRIYDGQDNTGPLLYDHVGGAGNLAGLQRIAPSGHIFMENSSDGSGSCQGGGQTQWAWQVGCLDCVPPLATFAVVLDCDQSQFSVDVNITQLGSDQTLDITNDGGVLPAVATAVGTYTVGPFANGTTVVVNLGNDVNTLCSVHSIPLTNPLCPTIVDCGGATLNETYCYINNDNHQWHWASAGGQPLAIQFSAGTIESASYDHLTIYDGPDANAPVLYDHVGGAENLAGLLRISTGSSIYMKSSSDASSSCASGSQTQWAWEVGCLDCTDPGASYTLVEDCIHHTFSIEVNVDSTGSGSFVRIANSLSTDTLTNIPAGLNTVGPFPMDSTVVLTVMNETNNLCRVYSQAFSAASAACVQPVCAAEAYEYCYSNSDTAWFAYQGTENVPVTIEFLWGRLLADDFIQIYNGVIAAPDSLLWQGNLNGNMAGFARNTTSGSHAMLLRVVSNSAYSCATGHAFPPLHWVVQCGAVGVQENPPSDFSMYPNPTTGDLMIQLPLVVRGTADLRIVDIAGRTVHQESFNSSGGVNHFDVKGLQGGNYSVTITTNDWVKTQRLQIVH